MEEKLAKINEELDELAIKQLELTQDYINVTIECESHQKAGFLNLAKARFIQGSHSVSKNCLFSEDSEEERNAILTVTRQLASVDLGGNEEGCNEISYNQPMIQVDSDTNLEAQLNKQFGLLSSGTLKSAKGDFRKCIEKTMERANVIEQSLAIRKRYSVLMNEKRELLSKIPTP